MSKRIVFLALAACLLTACGNKGALVLPDKPAPAAATPPAPAAGAPAAASKP